jgi:hypothetical protein
MPDPGANPHDAASPTMFPRPEPTGEDGPLCADDEALLRELGGWLHTRARYDADGSGPEIVVAPPLPPLSESQIQARVDAVLGRDRKIAARGLSEVGGRRRRWWPLVVTHAAVAASTVLAIRLWTAEPVPPPNPYHGYVLALEGGHADTLGASQERVYLPDSPFVLEVHSPSGAWPGDGALELVIRARRADAPRGAGADIVLPPKPMVSIDGVESVLRYSTTTEQALPGLPTGRWMLTFVLGAPGACVLPEPERCITVGSDTIELGEPGGANAP